MMHSQIWKFYLNPQFRFISSKKVFVSLARLCHHQDFKSMYPYFAVSILFLIRAIATTDLYVGIIAILMLLFSFKFSFFAKLEILSKKLKNLNVGDFMAFIFNLCFLFWNLGEFDRLSHNCSDEDFFRYFEILAMEFFFLINMNNFYLKFFSSLFFMIVLVIVFKDNFAIYHWILIFLSDFWYIFHLINLTKKESHYVKTTSRETMEEKLESSLVLNMGKLMERMDKILIVDSTRKPIYFSEDCSLRSIQEIYNFFTQFQFNIISSFKEGEEDEIHLAIEKNVFQKLKEEEVEDTSRSENKNLSLEKLLDQIFLEKRLNNNIFYIQYIVLDEEQKNKNVVLGVLTQNKLILKFKQDFIFKDWLKLSHQLKNQQKAISFVAHEFRTPLNCIVNMLQCLEYYIDPDLSNEYVNFSSSFLVFFI